MSNLEELLGIETDTVVKLPVQLGLGKEVAKLIDLSGYNYVSVNETFTQNANFSHSDDDDRPGISINIQINANWFDLSDGDDADLEEGSADE